jgi:hypothetical protein
MSWKHIAIEVEFHVFLMCGLEVEREGGQIDSPTALFPGALMHS